MIRNANDCWVIGALERILYIQPTGHEENGHQKHIPQSLNDRMEEIENVHRSR